jgi:phosphoglycolate phosphatase-like HAD superfamily hydrolase
MKTSYKVIFWDFDGVILNSNAIRDEGFEKVLTDYPEEHIEELMQYHKKNGGLSRYVKFRYFFEEVRGEQISENEVNRWAEKFSEIMVEMLNDRSLLIDETNQYIKENFNKQRMHIVSGSDQNELRYLCKELKIDRYFKSIHGSPTAKSMLVKQVIEKEKYSKEDCLLIGDSINDKEAAENNFIDFKGYNFLESR